VAGDTLSICAVESLYKGHTRDKNWFLFKLGCFQRFIIVIFSIVVGSHIAF